MVLSIYFLCVFKQRRLWLVNLHICTGAPEPSMLIAATSTKSNGLTPLVYSFVTSKSKKGGTVQEKILLLHGIALSSKGLIYIILWFVCGFRKL